MAELKRKLTLFDLTMIAIGSTIGSGIFFTPSLIASTLQTPLLILSVWLIGGLMALSGALTFSELSSMYPKAGGVYVYLKEGYGELAGFLYGWAYFWVVNTGAIAAVAVAFATYFSFFFSLSAGMLKLTAISGIIVVTLVNVFGVKAGGIFSDIFTVLKLIGIVGLIFVGMFLGSFHTSDFSSKLVSDKSLSNLFAIAMVGVLWSYGGWHHATFTSSEAINPKKDMPRAITIAAIVITSIYLLINLAYMFLLTPGQIGSSSTVAADAVVKVLGTIGGSLIAIVILISTFGTAGIYTLAAPRIYFAMASDKLFFSRLAEVHHKFHTPANAIVIQSVWAIILIMFWGTFENLISYVEFVDWIFFGLTGASIFIFRKRYPYAQRSTKTFAYPITPLFFVGMAIWFVVNTLINKPEQAWAGLIFLGMGVISFFYWRMKRNRNK